jgi:hypothetical protein
LLLLPDGQSRWGSGWGAAGRLSGVIPWRGTRGGGGEREREREREVHHCCTLAFMSAAFGPGLAGSLDRDCRASIDDAIRMMANRWLVGGKLVWLAACVA